MPVEGGIPEGLLLMPEEEILAFADNIARCWLAQDGLWFQAVEFSRGMNDARRCNDSTWARFSPFEAHSIKRLLGLGEEPGLDGFEKALAYRMYARLNRQDIERREIEILFTMQDCRVQRAREKKGLPDYPCKSAGLVEYSFFAEGIDKRFRTECVACPPDEHPDAWHCRWRFTLKD